MQLPLNEKELILALEEIYIKEKDTDTSEFLDIKPLPFELKKAVFKHALTYPDLLNSYMILNIFNLIKGYNTFDDSFFENPSIYFNTLEEFLDIKTDLATEINVFMKQLIVWYLSVLRSCSIVDENAVTMPFVFQRIILAGDFVSLANIFSKVPDINNIELFVVKDAYVYLTTLVKKFAIGDMLMEALVNGNSTK
jgi:hypothetical protein